MIAVSKDINAARAYADSLKQGAATPQVDPARFPLTTAMATYVLDFDAAREKRALQSLNVQERLKSLRGVAVSLFSFRRSVAGLLVLAGLLLTLLNLSLSVGPLGEAFRKLGEDQRVIKSSSAIPEPNSDSASQQAETIETSMSKVVIAAQRGFLFSMVAILAAFSLLCQVLWAQSRVLIAVARFGAWAEDAFRDALPEQISGGVGALAIKRDDDGISDLIRVLTDLKFSLGTLADLSGTMGDVRDAIVKSLDAMPGHIQASMGLVSKDMVRSLERNMKEEVESIKKILAIYGQQEFRIDEIRQYVEAVKVHTEKISNAVNSLEGLPKQLIAMENGLEGHSTSAQRLDASVQHLEQSVRAIPSEELRNAATELIKATSHIARAHGQALEAIAELERTNSAGLQRDTELGKRLAVITTVSQQFLGAYDGLNGRAEANQKLLVESLERVTIQMVREITSIGQQWSDSAPLTQLRLLQSAITDIGETLRAIRVPPQNGQMTLEGWKEHSDTGSQQRIRNGTPTEVVTWNEPQFQSAPLADANEGHKGDS